VTALFFAFAKMSVAGFGGVLYWARRAIVDQKRWLTADEFNETYALCHFLPGPNIVNFSMVFGARLRGIVGGLAAFAGLLVPPMLIMTAVAALYARYGEIDALRRMLAGISCAAVGLFIANVLRMAARWLRVATSWAARCWSSYSSRSASCGCHWQRSCSPRSLSASLSRS
jgi:chromate transporter